MVENKLPITTKPILLPTIIEETEQEKEEENWMDFITLQYLMNHRQYEKYKNKDFALQNNARYKKDKKFYKKRILDLTRQLFLDTETNMETNMETKIDKIFPDDVMKYFDQYIKTCIHYFKELDKMDIVQEEYKDYKEKETILQATNDLGKEKDDIEHFAVKKKVNCNLNHFVIRKKKSSSSSVMVPRQKNIHLYDPELKNKGLGKKKNINTNYDEIEKQENKNKNDDTK
jgi:hypothetical protein